MAGDPKTEFLIKISAEDDATAAVKKINSQLAKLGKPLVALADAQKKAADSTGLKKTQDHLAAVRKEAMRSQEQVANFRGAIAALTTGTVVVGMEKMLSRWSEMSLRISQAAYSAHIGSGRMASLSSANALAGGSAEEAAQSMVAFHQAITDSKGGRAPQVAQMVTALGMSLSDLNDESKFLPHFADAIKNLDPALQRRAADAFGLGGMLPELKDGSGAYNKHLDDAKRHGAPNAYDIAMGKEYALAIRDVEASFDGLGTAISTRTAPYLLPMLHDFGDWVDGHRAGIATFFSDAALGLESVGRGAKIAEPILKGFLDAAALTANDLTSKLGIDTSSVSKYFTQMENGALKVKELLGIKTAGDDGYFDSIVNGAKRAAIACSDLTDKLAEVMINTPSKWGHEAAAAIGSGASAAASAISTAAHGGAGSNVAPGATGTGGGGSRPTVIGSAPSGPVSGEAKEAIAYFESTGHWTHDQAAALAARGIIESGLRTNVPGDSGNAHGVYQWHSQREKAIEEHFHKSLGGMSFHEQLQALDWEATEGPEKGAGDAVRRTRGAAAAGAAVSRYLIRPGLTVEAKDREANNTAALAQQLALAPRATAPAVNVGGGTGATAAGAGAAPGGTVNINIDHSNVPAGVTMKSSSTGQGLAPPVVRQSMAEAQ